MTGRGQGAVLPCLCVTHCQSQPRGLGHPGSALQELGKTARETLPGAAAVTELGNSRGRTLRKELWGTADSSGSLQTSEMDPGSLGQQMQAKRR